MTCTCCGAGLGEVAKVSLCPTCFQALRLYHRGLPRASSNEIRCEQHKRLVDPTKATV